jgi:putative redox protein
MQRRQRNALWRRPTVSIHQRGYNLILLTLGLEHSMECTVKWAGAATEHHSSGMRFDAHTGSGHIASMDGAPEGGGNNLAPRPMELVLAGTGGCTAYDVVLILKRGRQAVTGCEVRLSAERAPVDPKVFTKIHFHFTVTGKDLNPATVKRAVALSHEKYCSASIMLAHSVAITHTVSVVQA